LTLGRSGGIVSLPVAKMSKRILIVSDGKPGHENQSRALCAGLGASCEVTRVAFPSRLAKAATYAWDHLGFRSRRWFDVTPFEGSFDAVVGTGSGAFFAAHVLARKLQVPVAAVLYPRGYRLDFDCIVAPTFDAPPPLPQVVPVPVNLTNTDAAFYEQGVVAFRARHTPQRPAVGVILGGPNPFARMEVDDMARQLDRVFAATEGCERWVTTSRRTPAAVEDLVDRLPFDFKVIYSRNQFNPIPAFVMLCDTLFVSSDSTGMLSEAVTRGTARVEVLMNLRCSRSKFARFVRDLARDGHAHVFEGTMGDARRKIDLAPALRRVAELLRL
jgi:mitochondrial fission protein ELM1